MSVPYLRTYWDKFINNKSAMQYYRCQAFGHTSANCFKNSRYVKCLQNHLTANCKKTPDTPAKYYNCSSNHPASYSLVPISSLFKISWKTCYVQLQDIPADIPLVASNKNLRAKVARVPSRLLAYQTAVSTAFEFSS